jgi:hypothetical protein
MRDIWLFCHLWQETKQDIPIMTSLPIELPVGFTPLITQGDLVTIGQLLARKEAPQDEVVNILQSLNVSRNHAKKVLKKGPGEKINPGDVIAIKKSLFGKEQARIISEIAGTIIRYERDTGNLVVRTQQEPSSLEIISPVAGSVTLCNNREIVIETDGALVTTGVTLGKAGEGTLFILRESFDDSGSDNAVYYLDSRATDKIVLAKTLTRELVIKGDSIGVIGFLGMTISNEDITYLQEKQFELPVIEISQELVVHLHRWENRKIMVETRSKAIILRE